MFYILENDCFWSKGLRRPDPARIQKASIFCVPRCPVFLVMYNLDESRSCFELDKVLWMEISKYSV